MEITTSKKCRRIRGHIGPIRYDLNPVVTLLSAVIIWAVVVWCIIQPKPAYVELSSWMLWVTKCWTWLYIGTQDAWTVFIIVVYFSKYSKIKLGKPDDQPEYGNATYFTMLFAAGIGMGLFYFGVAEPIWHYEPGKHGNRFWGRYVKQPACLAIGRKENKARFFFLMYANVSHNFDDIFDNVTASPGPHFPSKSRNGFITNTSWKNKGAYCYQ